MDDTSAYWPAAESLYQSAFPAAERRDLDRWRDLRLEEPAFTAYAILLEEAFGGFLTVWQFEDFVYVEHFAVSPDMRGGGIGAQALATLIVQLSLPVVLEVEPAGEEMADRRIGFYRRNGFTLDERRYLQPPYRPGDDWLPLCLMSTDPVYLEAHYEKIVQTIYERVYGIAPIQ